MLLSCLFVRCGHGLVPPSFTPPSCLHVCLLDPDTQDGHGLVPPSPLQSRGPFTLERASTPQTTAEPTNKTLSDIVRKGQSPLLSRSPPALPRVRSPVPEVGEGGLRVHTEVSCLFICLFVYLFVCLSIRSEVRPLGRGRRPKAQSTSDTSNQSNQLSEPLEPIRRASQVLQDTSIDILNRTLTPRWLRV